MNCIFRYSIEKKKKKMGNISTSIQDFQKIVSLDSKSDEIHQILQHIEKSKSNITITEKLGITKNNLSSFPTQLFKFSLLKE